MRAGPCSPIVAAAVALAVSGCWVQQIHIEPDGRDAGRDEGDEAESSADGDGGEAGDGRDGEVPSTCGNGLADDGEECDGDPPGSCSDGACVGTRSCDPATCTWNTCTFGPPPINDDCSGALDISAGGLFAGDTCGARDDHAPAAGCGGGDGRDLWFRFRLAQREIVYFDTVDGNEWDTIVQVRRGGCPGPGSPVVCGDDECEEVSGGRRSQVVGPLDAGDYHVVVDGKDPAAAGPFVLRFQHAPCADAWILPGDGNYDGSTAGRGDGYAGSCGGSASPDGVYYFGLCGPRTLTASTCNTASGFDSVLAFAAGGCDGTDEVACNDDDPACVLGTGRSTVTADLPQGLNFLVVDGRRGGPGPFRVTVSGF